MLRHPFLASAVARLPVVDGTEMHWCATAATDGYNVYVDAGFFESLSDGDALFVLAHEYLHVVLGHADRRRGRVRQTWNQATDFAINQTLVEFGFDMPPRGLFDPRFRGETAEKIYEALLQDGRRSQRSVAVGLGKSRPGEASDELGQALDRLDEALTDAQRDRLVANGGWDIQLDPDDPEGAGSRDEGSLTEKERGQMRISLAEALRSQTHGRSAGYLADEITAASEPYVAWEVLLAQFMGGIRRSDYRTYPFNKKHIHRGLYLPTLGAPGPEHLVVALDTSGSIYRELAERFLGEIDAIRQTGECKLTLLHCDARVEHVDVFEPWDAAFTDTSDTRIYGRGGTSFVPPFRWVDQQLVAGEAPPDALIYLTDGYGTFPTEEPMFPVLWVLSADGTSDEHIPFGSIIRMPALRSGR